MRSSMEIKEGDIVKIDVAIIYKYTNAPQYINLVKKVIRMAKGNLYVSFVNDKYVRIRSWKHDFLGDITIPRYAVTKVIRHEKFKGI